MRPLWRSEPPYLLPLWRLRRRHRADRRLRSRARRPEIVIEIKSLQSWLEGNLFASAAGPSRRPQLSENFESTIPGLFVVGDLAGAPVIKLAMEQGYNVIEHIASLPRPSVADGASGGDTGVDVDVVDVLVIGAGAAGLNTALAAGDRGLSCVLLEKAKIANTIENFPEGKWVYAEPDNTVPRASCGWTVPRKRT